MGEADTIDYVIYLPAMRPLLLRLLTERIVNLEDDLTVNVLIPYLDFPAALVVSTMDDEHISTLIFDDKDTALGFSQTLAGMVTKAVTEEAPWKTTA